MLKIQFECWKEEYEEYVIRLSGGLGKLTN